MRVAAGFRVHSGWAAAIVVGGDVWAPEVLDRRRLALVDDRTHGASQPYHFAKQLKLKEAEAYLQRCAAIAKNLAAKFLEDLAESLLNRQRRFVGCGILLAAGRPLPALAETLASHALIHTAEGQFFRRAIAEACEQLGLGVEQIQERELFERAAADWRVHAAKIKQRLEIVGRSLGPPWAQDQKHAALAGLLALEPRHAGCPALGV
jgi:hypothetical protein